VADVKVGSISHYFGKIGVAVLDVTSKIKVGDQIKIKSNCQEFNQEIGSMQMEHENIKEAKKGQSVGLKVDQLVKPGDKVFLAE